MVHQKSIDYVSLQLALLVLVTSGEKFPQDVASANQVVKLLSRKVALSNKSLQPLVLLLSIALVLAALLEHLDVVLSIFVLEAFRSLLCLFKSASISTLGLGNNGIERFNGTTNGIETTADSAVRSSIRVEEFDEIGFSASAIVRKSLGGALLEVLDRGVRRDTLVLSESLAVLSFGIHLGNNDIGFVGESVGELLPDRLEVLAVYSMSA